MGRPKSVAAFASRSQPPGKPIFSLSILLILSKSSRFPLPASRFPLLARMIPKKLSLKFQKNPNYHFAMKISVNQITD